MSKPFRRCRGVGFWEDCETCLRRIVPPHPDPRRRRWIEPPAIITFWCPWQIEPRPPHLSPSQQEAPASAQPAAIAQQAEEPSPTFQPIPVSERLPGPNDCCPNPRNGQGQWCWAWVQHDPIPYRGCWRMMPQEWLFDEALAWAPWWAFPLPGGHSPGAKEMAEGQS